MRNLFASLKLLFLSPFLLFPIATGCSTYSSAGSQFKERHTRLVIPLPQGWLRFNNAKGAYVLTKDGLRLDQISIRADKVGDKIEGTARVYQPGMLPNEIAELSLGLMEARDETKNFKTTTIEATSIAGHDGFLAEADFVDSGGLPKRATLCGALFGEHVIQIAYVAARDVYFERSLPAYQQMLKSAHVESE